MVCCLMAPSQYLKNVDLLVMFCDIPWKAISRQTSELQFYMMSLKMTIKLIYSQGPVS